MQEGGKKGFTKGEGAALYILSALQLIAVVIMFLMLWHLGYFIFGLGMLLLYIFSQIGFLRMYHRRLCVSCPHRCPFNPNIRFWRSSNVTEVE